MSKYCLGCRLCIFRLKYFVLSYTAGFRGISGRCVVRKQVLSPSHICVLCSDMLWSQADIVLYSRTSLNGHIMNQGKKFWRRGLL